MTAHFTVHNLFVVNNRITICMVSSSFLTVNAHLEMILNVFLLMQLPFSKCIYSPQRNVCQQT